jgi:hypothetical protein
MRSIAAERDLEVGDQWQVIRGSACELAAANMPVFELCASTEIEAVQRSQRNRSGKGVDQCHGTPVPGRLEEPAPERSPEIIEIAPDDARSVAPERAFGLVLQEAGQLLIPLTAGQAKVQVVQHERPLMSALAQDSSNLEGTASLACANRQIDAMRIVQGEARQHRVAVSSAPEPVFVTEGHVSEAEALAQFVGLVLEACTRQAFRDFLQEDDVRSMMTDERSRPIEPVTTVDTSHPFVDVPSQDPDLHLPGFGLLLWRLCRWPCMLAQPS